MARPVRIFADVSSFRALCRTAVVNSAWMIAGRNRTVQIQLKEIITDTVVISGNCAGILAKRLCLPRKHEKR
jgi:hypothetical protein